MPAEAGITVKNDFNGVTIREIDFVTQFAKNWQALSEILGIMRPIKKSPGTKLVAYQASMKSASLQGGSSVGEGEKIPFTEFQVEPVAYGDVTIEKYAKAVTVEAVAKYGASVAVDKTDEAFLNELQGTVLDRFYTFLETGSLTEEATSFKKAIAISIGLVRDKFKKMRKDTTGIVTFVNTLDFYNYLGDSELTTQTLFGLEYLQNYLGAQTIILTSEIDEGTVISTPVSNIDLYYIDPSDSDFAKLGLQYTTDGETNLIGFHAQGDYSHALGESYALMGMTLWAEYLDAIAVVSIESES